jgi:hypothetical protein
MANNHQHQLRGDDKVTKFEVDEEELRKLENSFLKSSSALSTIESPGSSPRVASRLAHERAHVNALIELRDNPTVFENRFVVMVAVDGSHGAYGAFFAALGIYHKQTDISQHTQHRHTANTQTTHRKHTANTPRKVALLASHNAAVLLRTTSHSVCVCVCVCVCVHHVSTAVVEILNPSDDVLVLASVLQPLHVFGEPTILDTVTHRRNEEDIAYRVCPDSEARMHALHAFYIDLAMSRGVHKVWSIWTTHHKPGEQLCEWAGKFHVSYLVMGRCV